jgi:cyclopropane fatty-acyl-phospholipid synthase-like methyltransferase
MDGNFIASNRSGAKLASASSLSSVDRITEFYDHAGHDYAHWSRGMNMHLGFWRRGMNPLNRESMLEQMNLEVAKCLGVGRASRSVLLDLGCGVGSIARSVAARYPGTTVRGFTLVRSQVEIASQLNLEAKLDERVDVRQAKYTFLPVDDASADGAWAVESACYATGANKHDLIQEVARVLKFGGRFVVADCFIKSPERKLNWLIRRCYRVVCDCWALDQMPTIEDFVAALDQNGFREILVEDISWRVAPSLAHAPFAVLTFIVKKVLSREPLNRHSINNLKASLLALMLGLNRSKFSYYIITGTRGESGRNER